MGNDNKLFGEVGMSFCNLRVEVGRVGDRCVIRI